jgi:hypothetical protein
MNTNDCAAPSALDYELIPNPGLTAGAIDCRAFGTGFIFGIGLRILRVSAGLPSALVSRPEGPAMNKPGRQAGITREPKIERRRRGTSDGSSGPKLPQGEETPDHEMTHAATECRRFEHLLRIAASESKPSRSFGVPA